MSKLAKALGLVSALAALSDVSGMTAFYSDRKKTDETPSMTVISEDHKASARNPRRSQTGKTAESKPRRDEPRPITANSTLFADIVAERELFTRFDFGRYERHTLCGLNRKLGENRIGLLLLEPSGILKSPVIDRGTLKVLHEKVSIPRKELREELARNGVLVSDARLIAWQVAGIRENNTPGAEKEITRKTLEEASGTPKLSPEQREEILERFRRELAIDNGKAVKKP
jgi:hypothetical protein